MNAIKCLAFFLFVAAASGVAVERKSCLLDPWIHAREMCRKQCGLTREELSAGNHNFRLVANFLVCHHLELGSINRDGSINENQLVKNLALTNPETITRPIIRCCVDRVYGNKLVPSPHEVGTKLADFVTCYRSLMSGEMFALIGLLEPPTYPRLNKCKNCW